MITLYGYQAAAVAHLLRSQLECESLGTTWSLAVLPTGSGKTLVAKAAVALAVQEGMFDNVLVCTSLRSIEGSFRAPAEIAVDFALLKHEPDHEPRHLDDLDELGFVELGFIDASAGELTNTAQPICWVPVNEMKGPLTFDNGRQYQVAQHARVANYDLGRRSPTGDLLDPGDLPRDMSRTVVVIDECHHQGHRERGAGGVAEQTNLHQFAQECAARGATVWMLSATPFRADGGQVYPANIQPFVRRYAELADAGFLPKHVELHTLTDDHLVGGGDQRYTLTEEVYQRVVEYLVTVEPERQTVLRVSSGYYTGDDADARDEASTVAVADRFEAMLTTRFEAEWQLVGGRRRRVLNTVGDGRGGSTVQALAEMRAALDEHGYEGRTYDVLITCRRLGEGADLPACSRVVSLGLPTHPVSVIQNIGRMTRLKTRLLGYPLALDPDRALYVAVVPPVRRDMATDQVLRLVVIATAMQGFIPEIDDFAHAWRRAVANFRLPPRRARPGSSQKLGGEEVIPAPTDEQLIGIFRQILTIVGDAELGIPFGPVTAMMESIWVRVPDRLVAIQTIIMILRSQANDAGEADLFDARLREVCGEIMAVPEGIPGDDAASASEVAGETSGDHETSDESPSSGSRGLAVEEAVDPDPDPVGALRATFLSRLYERLLEYAQDQRGDLVDVQSLPMFRTSLVSVLRPELMRRLAEVGTTQYIDERLALLTDDRIARNFILPYIRAVGRVPTTRENLTCKPYVGVHMNMRQLDELLRARHTALLEPVVPSSILRDAQLGLAWFAECCAAGWVAGPPLSEADLREVGQARSRMNRRIHWATPRDIGIHAHAQRGRGRDQRDARMVQLFLSAVLGWRLPESRATSVAAK